MPQLGWIPPSQRTNDQNDAHALALSRMIAFTLPYTAPPKGTKVILTDFWKNASVVADVGFEFNGFYQFTGSCVGVSTGNAVFTLGAVQRTLSDAPTKAFVPFWGWNYGTCRYKEGDRGQGEGAVDSVMGEVLKTGVLVSTEQGLPQFKRTSDGMQLDKTTELRWSDGGSSLVKGFDSAAKQFPVGGIAPLSSVDDIAASIINGYPVLDGCEYYIGGGSIKGSGADAYVVGKYDGRGGHSTCILGYWNHPNDGELFLYSNQWGTSTYPTDPAGGGRCCVWTPRSNLELLFSRYGGDNGETMALSHLNYLPAQPDILRMSDLA